MDFCESKPMKFSASVLIRNQVRQYLLLQRSAECQRFAGCWEFPGGKVDAGETAAEAIIREAREEAGIEISLSDKTPRAVIRTSNGEVEYSLFAWDNAPSELPVTLSHEHQAYKWVSFTEARGLTLMAPHREFLERFWHAEQLATYQTELPHYTNYAKTLQVVLNRLKSRWAPLAIVQAREKALSSFAEKCLRKADKYNDPAHELTDLCGGRIIATTTREAETLCRQIRGLFEIDEDDDTSRRHEVQAFGYLSVHFIVHFPADAKELLGVPIPPDIGGRKAEIQVRTLLQHAHSEVTHDRLYKGGFKAPKHCEREAARVAAILESADSEFTSFVTKLDAYVGHYAAHLPKERRRREIEDLKVVLAHEANPGKRPALSLRIARLGRAAWDWQGVVDALEPVVAVVSPEQAAVQVELGNALCRLHRVQPAQVNFVRGVKLLEGVAQPRADLGLFLEAPDRSLRATALAWLGSALAKQSGQRDAARRCLSGAIQLAPEDSYHFTAFVELDVFASGSDQHLEGLTPALRQAAGRCEEHVLAGIEITRAWLTIAKIRLLLGENTGALEALCLATRCAENHHPLAEFQRSLDRLHDAIGTHRPFIAVLDRAALLLANAKECSALKDRSGFGWQPLQKLCDLDPKRRITLLAGSTSSPDHPRIAEWEQLLAAALMGYDGYLLTGGTTAGICGMIGRVAGKLNSAGRARINLVGYLPEHLPAGQSANPAYTQLVRTPGTGDFTLLEPLQMWADLLGSSVNPKEVRLLCLGGGELSAGELALAWALDAHSAVLGDDSTAERRFASVLQWAGDEPGPGVVLPDDPATLTALFMFDVPVEERRWEKSGAAVHEAYLRSQAGKAQKSNLLPWPLLRDDFKHSNRHQAACAVEILRQSGFAVEPTDLPAEKIPLPVFSHDEVEQMAEREHGRWNVERLSAGWRYAEKKDEERRLSPYLVPWKSVLLPDGIKEYDRNAVRDWPKILAQAGWQVRRN